MTFPLQYSRGYQYHDYDRTLHDILLFIMAAYIPFIIVSSSLVISAVVLMRKLHSPHNIILLAISTSDLLVAVVVIPIFFLLAVKPTQNIIFSNEFLCKSFCIIPDVLEVGGLCNLTLLGFDVFLQITLPLKYRNYVSYKSTAVCIVGIYFVNFFMLAVILGLRDSTCPSPIGEYITTVAGRIHLHYLQLMTCSLLILCFSFGIYTRCKHHNQHRTKKEKITLWLTMAFILFFSPSLLLLLFASNLDETSIAMWQDIAKTIRFLTPATNAIIIYYSRPVYKFAFRYFLTNNPLHWHRVVHEYNLEHYKSKITNSTTPLDESSRYTSNRSKEMSMQELSLAASPKAERTKKIPVGNPEKADPTIEHIEGVTKEYKAASNHQPGSSKFTPRRSTLSSVINIPSYIVSMITLATKTTESDGSSLGSGKYSSRYSMKSQGRTPRDT